MVREIEGARTEELCCQKKEMMIDIRWIGKKQLYNYSLRGCMKFLILLKEFN